MQWKRESETKLILIAPLTVSVGFSTLRSTRYKGKSGGEVRKRHSILIYCPTTVLLTTLSTMLLSVGHFEPWINTHHPHVPREQAVQYKRQHFGNSTLQLFYDLDNHFIWWFWLKHCTLQALMISAQHSPMWDIYSMFYLRSEVYSNYVQRRRKSLHCGQKLSNIGHFIGFNHQYSIYKQKKSCV